MNNKVELLAPAGDLERLKIAILYGADAVFCGGKYFSLRAKANNFSLDDLKEAVEFANAHNAKVHVTVNIVPVDDDMDKLDDYLKDLDRIGVHAIIVSSVYIMKRARELGCKFEIHVSTQQSLANSKAIEFFKENLNVNRAVLARECSIDNIKEIRNNTNVPIEGFIHGGMCSSYSGRCTLSNAMVDRDANKGGCAHSCRWGYHLYDNRKLVNDNNFVIASCDLMSIDYIPSLIDAGVNSFKIEGRMKSAYYIATIVNSYRQIIDRYYQKGKITDKEFTKYKEDISKAENRVTYSGFLDNKMLHQALLLDVGKENPIQSFIGQVLKGKDENGYITFEVRNYFTKGEKVEYFMPGGKVIKDTLNKIIDEDGNEVLIANHPKQILKVKTKYDIEPNTFIRKVGK